MNLLKSLKEYSDAQRSTSFYFIFFGISLLSLAGGTFFFQNNDPLINGMFWGSLLFGIFSIIIGIGYGKKHRILFYGAEVVYDKDKALFLRDETSRMEKVLIAYSTYQIIFIIILILVIGVIICFNNAFISGICIAVSIHFSGFMIIQAIARSSIKEYYIALRDAHSSNFILQDIE